MAEQWRQHVGDDKSLAETALAITVGRRWNRNNLVDRPQPPENTSSQAQGQPLTYSLDSSVLEHVNRLAQGPGVVSETDGFLEGRTSFQARTARR